PAWASWTDTAFAAEAELPVLDVAEFEPTYVAPEAPAVTDDEAAIAEQARALVAPLTTVRSGLLSWDVETVAADAGAAETRVSSPTATPISLARTMVDALTLPMLGEAAAIDLAGMTAHASYAAPGMVADRAHAWSVAQERSSADLAL